MPNSIPTPNISVVEIGPFAVHLYAICIITGVALAIWLGNRRFLAAYPEAHGIVSDVAIIAVPAGVLGGRLYHVITTPERFFGADGRPEDILKIWQGGLGIWGAISLGALGAFLSFKYLSRTRDLPPFRFFLDALAPGIVFAQAIGRWGNWFNAELFGAPTNLPWALEIPRWARPEGYKDFLTFHPTFLYESLWCALVGFLLIRLSGKLKGGQIFALYIATYCAGRLAFELIRIDEANLIAGIRVNVFVSVAVGLSALVAYRRFSFKSR
jgi:prolipoprotein diacylglyceryl transferase